MPYVHIAMFRCKPETPESRIEAMLQSVRNIKPHLPGLLDIRCGRNEHRNHKGFTHCINVVAKDAAALSAYRQHPLHEPIVTEYRQIVEDSVACDFGDDHGGSAS